MVANTNPAPIEEIDDTIHLSLRLGAKANRSDNLNWTLEDRIRAFHIVMKLSDADWPFALAHFDCDPDGTYTVNEFCQHCGGVVYTAPMISPAEIIALADQFGLSIIKMRYMRECDCVVIQNIQLKPDEVKTPTTMGELVANILDKREAETSDADKTEAELIEEILNSPDIPEDTEAEEAKADIKAAAAPASGYGFAAIAEYEKGTKLIAEAPAASAHNSTPPSWENCLENPSWENCQHMY